jgi:FtsP/CotA-like multicopper oxidase with cupredoxin domain
VAVSPLMLAPGERAGVIFYFSGMAVGTEILLTNDANAPFPGGDPVTEDTSQILQFRVVPLTGPDTSTIPAQLNSIDRLEIADMTRTLTLKELEDAIIGDPLGVFLNGSRWGNPGDVSETPRVGSREIWEIVNLTNDAHPIHLHLVDFQLLNRQDFDVEGYEAAWDELNPVVPTQDPKNLPVGPYLLGAPIPPPPNEQAEKDTIQAFPGQVTRIIIGFTPDTKVSEFPFDATARPGYVWHCHILEHEDNEMMRRMQLTKGSQ